jgi:hypothetical protein
VTALKPWILWGVVAAFAAMGAVETVRLLAFQPMGVDFLPLWTAARLPPREAYDFAAVTHAQAWLLPNLAWPRPFAYPPTTLIALAPLGLAPYWVALGLWLAIGLAALLWGTARLTPGRPWLALGLTALAPPVVLAVLVGQTVLLVGGLAALAMVWLEPRPRLAGALLAICAVLKPQAMVLAPVALIAMGAWEAALAALVTGAGLIGASLILFGPARWAEWIAVLPAFQAEIAAVPGMMAGVITPAGLANGLGLAGPAALALRAVLGLGAAILVWITFARRADASLRAAALLCAGLIVTPYAMHYDASLLVPAAAARAAGDATGTDWLLRLIALLAVSQATAPYVGSLAVLVFAALIAVAVLEPSPAAPEP